MCARYVWYINLICFNYEAGNCWRSPDANCLQLIKQKNAIKKQPKNLISTGASRPAAEFRRMLLTVRFILSLSLSLCLSYMSCTYKQQLPLRTAEDTVHLLCRPLLIGKLKMRKQDWGLMHVQTDQTRPNFFFFLKIRKVLWPLPMLG